MHFKACGSESAADKILIVLQCKQKGGCGRRLVPPVVAASCDRPVVGADPRRQTAGSDLSALNSHRTSCRTAASHFLLRVSVGGL